jgi:hypothetical protein
VADKIFRKIRARTLEHVVKFIVHIVPVIYKKKSRREENHLRCICLNALITNLSD